MLVFDTGNLLFCSQELSQKTRTADREKASAILDALQHMALDGVAVGLYDLTEGPAYLKENQQAISFPLLSANLRSPDEGKLLLKPYSIREIEGHRVGIFAVTDDYEKNIKRPDCVIEDSIPAAQSMVRELKEKGCSVIIMLSQLQQQKNKKVAAQVPGIDFILGSSPGTKGTDPITVNETAIVTAASRGASMGMVELGILPGTHAFFNLQEKEAVMKKLSGLPGSPATPESVTAERALLEEKLKHYEGKNSYRFTSIALDRQIPDEPSISALIEKFKQAGCVK